MSATYDLHAHTTCSDGTLTPAELVARAHANGVGALAITDHDVTDGLSEGAVAAERVGMRLVPGVEISVSWQRQTLHVVGLCIDPTFEPLQQGLGRLRAFRVWRAEEIGRRLRKKNIEGAYGHAREMAGGAVIARTHFARFLVAHGYVSTMGQAFQQYLGRGRVGHVPGQWAPLSEAIAWIRGAGGVPVMAHPARYGLTFAKLRRLLQEFKESGGGAIEMAAGTNRDEAANTARLAVELELLASSGSDYHGPEKAWMDLGRLPPLPAEVEPVWNSFAPSYMCRAR